MWGAKKTAVVVASELNPAVEHTLEEMLNWLSLHGRPYIHKHDDGDWSAWLEMYVSSPGAKFEVKSSYGKHHRTPRAAIGELIDLVKAVQASMKRKE